MSDAQKLARYDSSLQGSFSSPALQSVDGIKVLKGRSGKNLHKEVGMRALGVAAALLILSLQVLAVWMTEELWAWRYEVPEHIRGIQIIGVLFGLFCAIGILIFTFKIDKPDNQSR